jgi:hypothetical protein
MQFPCRCRCHLDSILHQRLHHFWTRLLKKKKNEGKKRFVTFVRWVVVSVRYEVCWNRFLFFFTEPERRPMSAAAIVWKGLGNLDYAHINIFSHNKVVPPPS